MMIAEHGFFSQKIVPSLYARIGEIINNQFSQHIYDDDIVDKILKELEIFERTSAAENAIRNIISNRQLMINNFL